MEYAQTNKVPSSVEEIPSSTEERMRNMRVTMEQYMNTASQRAREAAAYADRTVQRSLERGGRGIRPRHGVRGDDHAAGVAA